jgi:hypothetical protein
VAVKLLQLTPEEFQGAVLQMRNKNWLGHRLHQVVGVAGFKVLRQLIAAIRPHHQKNILPVKNVAG